MLIRISGGWGGIRTPETLARLPVFKTGAFNHSATHPSLKLLGFSKHGITGKLDLPPICHPNFPEMSP